MMLDVLITMILVLIFGGAIAYIVREKKKGTACIGCPHAGTCGKHKHQDSDSGCGCGKHEP